ncbi:hypothetical protein TNCV_3556271 [Trichonephila clavipes]|nr:hypothetical protein TNCV_3556271 [Trichonephila clavipes]
MGCILVCKLMQTRQVPQVLSNNKHWRNYNFSDDQNLKTQVGFNKIGYLLTVDLDLVQKMNEMTGPLCPLEYRDLCVYLELDEKIDKSDMPSAQIIAYKPLRKDISVASEPMFTPMDP